MEGGAIGQRPIWRERTELANGYVLARINELYAVRAEARKGDYTEIIYPIS
jgi:hypothetical protein